MASGGAHPVDPSMSSDNSPDEEETNIALTLDDIRSIQKQLMHYEKIAMSFLFYDDDESSLKMCKDCLKDRNKMVLIGFAKDNPPEVWSMKVLECLFYLKNYFLLNKYGLTEEDAARRFSKNSHILPRRLTLYKICESLTLAETKYVMDSVSSISEEEYLEVFFLKICNQSDWANVYKALSEIDKVEELAKELVFDTRSLLEAIPSSEGAASLPPHSDVPPPAGMSTYPIHDPNNVGLCIILNEIDFVRHDKREGSDKDVEALEATMREFNFEIITRKNVYSSFFGMPFHKLIISSLKKTHSIFFLVILSHGTQGVIFGSDDQPVSIEQHILKTVSCSVPPKLPKVLIIQACQGEKYLLSRKVVTDGAPLFASNLQNDNAKSNLQEIGSYISDTFIAMSTVPGFKAFRQIDKGSYFIQVLCQCLRSYPYETIYDIFTQVIKLVKEEVVRTTLPNNINVAQQPEFRSLLERKLYLKMRN